MVIEYYPPRKNPLQAFIYSLNSSPRARFWLIIAIVVLEGFYFYNVLGISKRPLELYDIVIGLGILVVFPGYIYLMFTLRLRTQKRTLSIGPEGIFTVIGQQTFRIEWSEIATIKPTPELVTISGKSGDDFYIPRSAFQDDAQRSEFIKLVDGYIRENAGNAR